VGARACDGARGGAHGAESKDSKGAEWEDTCLICKDGGNLVCCEYGHHEAGSERVPCYKAYHVECLGSTSEPPDGWCCPRHLCCGCPPPTEGRGPQNTLQSAATPLCAICVSCRNAYCQVRTRPPGWGVLSRLPGCVLSGLPGCVHRRTCPPTRAR
jgi:hypothetical protein